jgi:hypothetical protein
MEFYGSRSWDDYMNSRFYVVLKESDPSASDVAQRGGPIVTDGEREWPSGSNTEKSFEYAEVSKGRWNFE